MTRPLLVWGAGGNASVVADIVRATDAFEIVGFLDDIDPERKGETFCDAPVLGGADALRAIHDDGVADLVVAISENEARVERAARAVEVGFDLATLVHPTASVAGDARVGPGTVIKSTAVVEPMASIGANVSIGALAYVGHAVVVEDGANVCSGTRVAGSSVIERGAWIATGAIVRDHVRVGAGARIGAGSVVLGDIPAGVVAAGNPAEPRWRPGLFSRRGVGGGGGTVAIPIEPDTDAAAEGSPAATKSTEGSGAPTA